jgi:hypothetical protein
MKLKIYMQMFYLVKNTTTTIGCLTHQQPNHTWFNKYELRQAKSLMVNFIQFY